MNQVQQDEERTLAIQDSKHGVLVNLIGAT